MKQTFNKKNLFSWSSECKHIYFIQSDDCVRSLGHMPIFIGFWFDTSSISFILGYKSTDNFILSNSTYTRMKHNSDHYYSSYYCGQSREIRRAAMERKRTNGKVPQLIRRFVSHFRCTETNCHKSWSVTSEIVATTIAPCPNCATDVHASRMVSFDYYYMLAIDSYRKCCR